MKPILVHKGIPWILEKDDGHSQVYRHPFDPLRRLSVIDPTYTFQPSTADNYLYLMNPNVNYGSATNLDIWSLTSYLARIILKFDMTSQVPAGAIINSATLSLYWYGGSGSPEGRTYWAYRITSIDWTEGGSTWNRRYDSSHLWTTPGGDYTATDGASVVMPGAYAWIAWTVTAQVQTAVDNVGRIAHFLLKDGAEGSGNIRASFYSKEYGTAGSRPKLYVDWSAGALTYLIAPALIGL